MYNLKEIIDYFLFTKKLNIDDLKCDDISYEIVSGKITDLIEIKFFHNEKSLDSKFTFKYTDSIINYVNKTEYLTYIRTKKLKNINK